VGKRELKMLRALGGVALVLMGGAALTLRAPARSPRLSMRKKPLKGCPEEGGSQLGEKFAGFSEAMAMYEDGSTSEERGSTCARAGEKGLDRAAPKGLATSPAATTARLQLYKNYGADGLYAEGFDSETEAKAELVQNGIKHRAGGMYALHAVEQVSYVQYENYRLNGSDAGANSETVTAWAAGRASVPPQVDQLSTSAARPRVKEVSASPVRLPRSAQALAAVKTMLESYLCKGKPSYSCVSSFEQAAEGCSGEIIGGCRLMTATLAGSANKPAGIDVLDVVSAEQAPTPGTTMQFAAPDATRAAAARTSCKPATTSWTSRPPGCRLCPAPY